MWTMLLSHDDKAEVLCCTRLRLLLSSSIPLQAMMLPEAVRMVNLLVSKGHSVYVHCTAGINRATLTAVAYLYFVQGLRRDEALAMVTNCRKIANPYMDCMSEAKRRLLGG